jgi:hypothetical protein
MPDRAKNCIDGLSLAASAAVRSRVFGQRLGNAGKIALFPRSSPIKKCEVYFAMTPDFASCAAVGFSELPLLRHVAQFVVA